ncbi:MAG TPA: 5-methyltetrahydropteroyltriglutamate--homocysteine S-methyltransferase, partial [Acidimicrobiales bacterium]|nr:5-methyltetrahydropteroyltriglutamate--homocysteine S-methyltransferase [Acidimicrobiales bacterium]
ANLGFPRMGSDRELKWALESAWRSGSHDELRSTAAELRARHWQLQQDRGIERIPVGDFSLYDHMLDAALAVGAVPSRFGGEPFDPESDDDADWTRYFVMARGGSLDGADRAPLEMTKWFDTNYHQLVPELDPDQSFQGRPARLLAHLAEARTLGVPGRVVLVGPLTFLARSKRTDGGDPVELIERLVPAYVDLVRAVHAAGCEAFQFDEPVLVTDVADKVTAAFGGVYSALREAAGSAEITVASYFGDLGPSTELAVNLPIDVLHLDLVRGADQLDHVLRLRPEGLALSLGVVDGRNLWRSDLDPIIDRIAAVVEQLGPDAVQIAPSCSLLHLPTDLSREDALDPELRSWLAFATERLDELRVVAAAVDGRSDEVRAELETSRAAAASRRGSTRVHRPEVAARVAAITPEMARRSSPFATRAARQAEALHLPPLPTTTIGSFPQTREIRDLRRKFRRGEIDAATYDAGLRDATEACVRSQEDLGLDVLVHGEFERTDMVEYFGDQLEGFFTTANGWVQSYGSRCVKPPVLFGDVVRDTPMTVEWTKFAQNLTDLPMKGMLTGPVTILEWSFVRDDQDWATSARQLALVLRDEVTDLIEAGIPIIQIDEPALREGLPLRQADQAEFLGWATEAFRLAAGSAPDEIQVHTHMCYGDFGDIIDAIIDLDVDVISMEASRSQMELLDDFTAREYPNEIGPGIWDIHSPRVPSDAELDDLLTRAIEVFGADRLWVNPDCGLKTRGWPETTASLTGLVAAARRARTTVTS